MPFPSIRSVRAALLAGVLCALTPPGAALARPFDDTDLFSGHSLRQSSKDRKIAAGVNFHVAPISYVAKKAIDQVATQVDAKFPGVRDLMHVLEHVDTARARDLASAGKVGELKNLLRSDTKAHGYTLNAEESKAIDNISAANLSSVSDVIHVVGSPGNALVFGLEPWAEYNFGTYDLTAYLPLAGFHADDATTFQLGNVNLDFRAGSRRGMGLARYGWTGGLSLFLPTGSKNANQVALSNLLVMPKYLHEYLSLQPYGIFGVEFGALTLMARLEFTHMQAMRDNPLYSSVDYANWGVSTVLHVWVVDFLAELDGLNEVRNAPAMTDIFGTVGGRLHIGPVRAGLAARVPLTSHPASLYADSLGTGFSNIARLNILATAIMSF